MTQTIAYSDGQFVPADQLLIRPTDLGFMLGVTVAEQLRTFRGEVFEQEAHFNRLQRSLRTIGIEGVSVAEVADAVKNVVRHNHRLLATGNDLGVTIFVTPGDATTFGPHDSLPRVGIHTFPLPFRNWADRYEVGQPCSFVSVPQIEHTSWPRSLKCRSRMHYFLADREARESNPNSRAILLDMKGRINEASTANVVAYFKSEGLISPPLESILPGISLSVVERLASRIGDGLSFRHLTPNELMDADEVLLTSTPFCVLPVSQLGVRAFDQRDCFQRLIEAWSDEVGLDIIAQAGKFTS